MRQLVLDANLLVLLVVGLRDPALIDSHRRTNQFARDDFETLRNVLAGYDSIVVTPNVLTEASNLLRYTSEPAATGLMTLLGELIHEVDERYIPSRAASESAEFPRLGLTDVGILEAVGVGSPLLTVDLDLYLAASRKAPGHALNFNHMRVL